jgi:UDP-glucuronate decarboxylase
MIESVKDNILQEDLYEISNCKQIEWHKLSGKSILVTGGTGLIGSQIVKALACANRIKELNMNICVLARNYNKVQKILGELVDRKDINIILQDIQQLKDISLKVDYIIHGASVTSSQEFVKSPVETIDVGLIGTKNILEIGRKNSIEGMVYLSSMEVYGVSDFNLESVNETDYGYIDPLDIRSSYSEGKRMIECMCSAYVSQYNMPIKVARLVQTFGPGIEKNDNRVFAQFARSVMLKKDIILHTTGETLRSYCYTRDAIIAILMLLTKGNQGEAYNIANEEETISIKDMAQMLVEHYGNDEMKVIIKLEDIRKYGYAPVIKMRINTDKMKLLGWQPKITLLDMYNRMIQSMNQITKGENL